MLEPDDSYVDDLQDLIIESEAHPERRLAIFLDYWERARKVAPEKASYASLLYSLAKGRARVAESIHITVTGQVANLNLGEQIGSINAALNNLNSQGNGGEQIVSALTDLTNAILHTSLLAEQQKTEAIETVSTIAQQAEATPDKRSKGLLRSVLLGFPILIERAKDVTELWDKWSPVLKSYFGL